MYGIDDPKVLANSRVAFAKEHDLTPERFVNELKGIENIIFTKLYGGNLAKKMYRLYEYVSV